MSMDVEAFLGFTEQELWVMLESVPESNKQLLTRLREALEALHSTPPIYGGSVRIKPRGSV